VKKEETKSNKEERLLNTGFKLFIEKGIKNTSIQDIVDDANVAKGTFYLYFKDKYEIQNILIAKKSEKLFNDALDSLHKNYIEDFADQLIYIINYIIDELKKKPALLRFISKNLSWGIYNHSIMRIYEDDGKKENGIYSLFMKKIEENHINLKNAEVTLFMIIELVSSTCFTSISENKPLPIEEYKPYLYETIRKIIKP